MTKFSAPQQNQLAQIGAFLRENREKQEKSLEDIAIRTYIRPQLLNGIETGNPDTLPEPIFVQGFIRRYGEALGLNGLELSQQFSVSSIPSTPRPAPPEPLPDSPTTRLTRASTPAQSAPSAPSIPTLGQQNTDTEALTLGRANDELMAASATYGATSEDNPASYRNEFESTVDSIAEEKNDTAVDSGFDRPLNDTTQSEPGIHSDIPTFDTQSATESSELDIADESNEEQDFSSMVAAFDRENMNQQALPEPGLPRLDQPNTANAGFSVSEAGTSTNGVPANSETGDIQFRDDLPAAFTTQAPTPVAQPAARPIEVGYEDNQTNLKPFVLGGILAAIALLGVLIASVIGGSRQPSVAENPEPIEQIEDATALPPLPEETAAPEAVAPPAISDAPIYVEGTAVREAWVSVIADGETVFEETLQPGDSQVWEAQESLSIYSGDAGALELAANGADAEVMGEAGQPDERIFP